jgi:predicted RNA-binding Zn ribbon-like protein
MLRELNLLIAKHPMRRRLVDSPNGIRTERWFRAEQLEDLFAPLAESAASLFTEVNRDRVRQCPACVLHFRDTSKKGTRRWCSMRLCGNRQKVAAYAARLRVS